MSAPMCPYTFVWPYEATEVFVTGSFDNWSKSAQLTKESGSWKAVVDLPADKKVLYKFVVDSEWKIDADAATESDETGNLNNLITVEALAESAAAAKKRAKNKKKKANQKNKKKSAIGSASNEDTDDFSRESTPGLTDDQEEQEEQKEIPTIVGEPLGDLAPAVEEPVTFEEPTPAVEKSVAVAAAEPSIVAVEEPVAIVVEEPVAVAVKEPVAVAVEEPVIVTVEEPVAVPVAESAVVTVDEPVIVAVEESASAEEPVNDLVADIQEPVLVEQSDIQGPADEEATLPEVSKFEESVNEALQLNQPEVTALETSPAKATTGGAVAETATSEMEPVTSDDQYLADAKEAVLIASRTTFEEVDQPNEAVQKAGKETESTAAANTATASVPATKESKPKKKGFISKLKAIFK
ncbi:hypothetical protein NADFUDRAFT_82797 [Nadsonia fulvescens var. elongata DSM 6958]|uniref:AMP-activated protein kinase glycogen-binding domain-containing protein n=1 Tax=Nadsonia fulvescens var. elongata DSM 6958 TaxID=857566 RepID=A0A1E3PKW9_9ASCO|nr:hypothetical protein NADFUDRAFT_82797 [Nadsonia fulvescens var. elongata DSM 6958]